MLESARYILEKAVIVWLALEGIRLFWVWLRAKRAWSEAQQTAWVDEEADVARWPEPPADSDLADSDLADSDLADSEPADSELADSDLADRGLRVESRGAVSILRFTAARTGNEIFGAVAGWALVGLSVWSVVMGLIPPYSELGLIVIAPVFFLSLAFPLLSLDSRIVRIERSREGLLVVRRFGVITTLASRIPASQAAWIHFSVKLVGYLEMSAHQDLAFMRLSVEQSRHGLVRFLLRGKKRRFLISCSPAEGQWLAGALEGWRRAAGGLSSQE